MSDPRRDAVAAFLLGLIAAAVAYAAVITLDPHFLDLAHGNDVWFEGDLARVFNDLTHRWAPHSRAPVHPLFSLLACAGVYAFRAVGLSPLHAVGALLAGVAGVWTVLLFVVLRAVTPTMAEAALFTVAGTTTSSAMFWLTVPETYGLGSATIVAALAMLAVAERRKVPEGWFLAVNAATIAITVTNWIAGLTTTALQWPWRRAVQISVNAFALVVVLWAAQRVVIPHADFFIGYSNEQRYVLRPETGGPRRIAAVMLAHSIVMPPVAVIEKPGRGPVMSVQFAAMTAGGSIRRVALLAWIVMLGVGVYSWLRSARTSRVLRAAGVIAGAEIGLHLLYGTETFLYSLNLVPMLIVIAACGTRSRARLAVVALALVLLVCGGWNNARRVVESRRFFTAALDRRSGDANQIRGTSAVGPSDQITRCWSNSIAPR